MINRLFLSGLIALGVMSQAHADARHIIEHDGGSVTLHLSQGPDVEGVLRGAIEFDNEPGWKTYWRDPGSSGIPPSLDVQLGAQALDVDIAYPAPVWLDDGYGAYAGYKGDVSLPIEIDMSDLSMADGPLTARFFAGVCREICIPVTGAFSIDMDKGRVETTLSSIRIINGAFAALPEEVASDQLVSDITTAPEGGWLVTLTLPDTMDTEGANLFASAEHKNKIAAYLAPPKRVSTDNQHVTWHVRAHQDLPTIPIELHLTLAAGKHSVKTRINTQELSHN